MKNIFEEQTNIFKTDSSEPFSSKRNLKAPLVMGIMLTSLVDIFSVLVLYMVFNSANSSSIEFKNDDLVIPKARNLKALDNGLVISIKESFILILDKKIKTKNLVQTIEKIKKERDFKKIIIRADSKMTYSKINSIISILSENDFGKISFALLPEGEKS